MDKCWDIDYPAASPWDRCSPCYDADRPKPRVRPEPIAYGEWNRARQRTASMLKPSVVR